MGRPKKPGMVSRSFRITVEQDRWLRDRELGASEILRRMIDAERAKGLWMEEVAR